MIPYRLRFCLLRRWLLLPFASSFPFSTMPQTHLTRFLRAYGHLYVPSDFHIILSETPQLYFYHSVVVFLFDSLFSPCRQLAAFWFARKVGGLKVTPFPVLHGEDYISHGFLFGPEGSRICYISDVSRVPPESIDFLREQSPVQLLVCDALMTTEKHQTHFRCAKMCSDLETNE